MQTKTLLYSFQRSCPRPKEFEAAFSFVTCHASFCLLSPFLFEPNLGSLVHLNHLLFLHFDRAILQSKRLGT